MPDLDPDFRVLANRDLDRGKGFKLQNSTKGDR